jgi:hypothetical protein
MLLSSMTKEQVFITAGDSIKLLKIYLCFMLSGIAEGS